MFANGTTIYAGTNFGAYRTTNNGQSWTFINDGLPVYGGQDVYTFALKGSNLYIGTDAGIYVSSNNGNNWSILNSRMTITQLYSLVINDSFIYAVTDNGILYSSISGMETNVESLKKTVPASYILFQNYPNPFNPATTISYQVPKPGKILIKVYMLGREIKTLVNEEKPAGSYSLKFDGRGLTSGIYIYRMIASDNVFTRKFVLLK